MSQALPIQASGIPYFEPLICISDHNLLSSLVAAIKHKCKFPSEEESDRITAGMRYFGLFSSEEAIIRESNLLDTLCGQLEKLLSFQPGERDLLMLQHKFVVEWEDGKMVSSLKRSVLPEMFKLIICVRTLLHLHLNCWEIRRDTRGCRSRSV